MTETADRAARYQDVFLSEAEAHFLHLSRPENLPRTVADMDRQDALMADLRGTVARLVAQHPEFCAKCEGRGVVPSKQARGLCFACRGSGVKPLACSICGRPTPDWEHTVCGRAHR